MEPVDPLLFCLLYKLTLILVKEFAAWLLILQQGLNWLLTYNMFKLTLSSKHLASFSPYVLVCISVYSVCAAFVLKVCESSGTSVRNN